jgi:hypothetical protein
MSELATEILGTEHKATDLDLIGSTFANRRAALQRVDAYRDTVKRALHDTILGMVGQEFSMTFRPSMVKLRDACYWVPCYALSDTEREPVQYDVTISSFSPETESIRVDGGESPRAKWTVNIANILAIEPVAPQADA